MFTCSSLLTHTSEVPPESTFARVKEYLLCLEGIFRHLPRDRYCTGYRPYCCSAEDCRSSCDSQ